MCSMLSTTGVKPMLDEAGKRFLTEEGDSRLTEPRRLVSDSSYEVR